MSRNVSLGALLILMFIGIALLGQPLLAQNYQLPNSNSGCPSNCRVIPWSAGSDQWNSGTLPVYAQVTCTPLNENGSTDDTTNINNCISAANAGTGSYSACHAAGGCAVFLPAGNIYVAGLVRLQSNVVVRGAQPEGIANSGVTWLPGTDSGATNIILGSSGQLTSQNFSYSGGNLYPATTYATFPSTYCYLSGTPQKGDMSETTSSSNGSSCATPSGTWIQIYGNDDPTLVYNNGTEGSVPPGDHCDWCGNATGFYTMIQTLQVTSATNGGAAGSTLTLGRPLYYTPYTAATTVPGSANSSGNQNEPAGAKYTIITFGTQKAGYENLRVDGSEHDVGANSMVLLQGCLYCWAQNLDVYVTGSSSGSAHIELDWTYGNELRNNYVHDQRSGASGAGYGYYIQFPSSDTKIENNVCRHSRHCIVFQGGGSGTAVLYNYFDDMYTDDTTYMGSARTSHGAHPFMNLFEGNVISHIVADDFWGTSSHTVFWRNWLWGDETMNWNLNGCTVCQSTNTDGSTNYAFNAESLYTSQTYYSYVGNVLGTPATNSIPTGANNSGQITSWEAGHTGGWPGGTLSATCPEGSGGTSSCDGAPMATPMVYNYGNGQLGGTVATSSGTIIRNGNYDYLTVGVAYWDSGSTNNTLANSVYYSSKPSFFGNLRWPIVGYDQSPVYGLNPAEATYLGANVNSNPVSQPPAAPTNLTATVN